LGALPQAVGMAACANAHGQDANSHVARHARRAAERAHEDGVSASELVRQGIELRLRLEQGGEYRIINRQLEPHHAPTPGAPVAAPSHETSEPSPVAAPSNGDA
jgi:hypothetical protein